MSNLPDEIIVEILLKLPIKLLGRCRCVSKPWRILISDPIFVKKHLDLVKKHEPSEDMMRFMIPYTDYDIKSCSLHTLFQDPSCSMVELDYPQKNLRFPIVYLGSCNGLVCLCLKKAESMEMFIWNPTTRESKTLPYPSSDGIRFSSKKKFGFGYDCSNDDYKVVIVHCSPSDSVVEVYSLRTNSWIRVEQHFHYNIDGPCKFVNGALHWVGTRIGQNHDDDQLVLSLDLVDLVFREVQQPKYSGYGFTGRYVQVLGESLCILFHEPSHVDVWVMKEYGVKESWTKLLTLHCTLGMVPRNHGGFCFSNYGLILIYGSRQLALYDFNINRYTFPMIDGDYIRVACEVEIFIETLVSPNAYSAQGGDDVTNLGGDNATNS